MRILEQPLHRTESENREMLRDSEKQRLRDGDAEGNRHDRRPGGEAVETRETAETRGPAHMKAPATLSGIVKYSALKEANNG